MAKADVDALIRETGIGAAGQKLRVAGVLYTYRCTIHCRHCLFACASDRLDFAMGPRQLADALALLHETGRVVHIAGGEAMMYWEQLSEGLRIAHEEGNAPHFVETNCSFAVDERVVTERLEFLAEHGVMGVLASADAFHQEFVPPERFLLVRRRTREIFGDSNFWGPREDDETILGLPGISREPERLRERVRAHPPVMVGNAHRTLAQLLDRYAPDDPLLPRRSWRAMKRRGDCLDEFRADSLWEIHLDPYGNVQTCCGIVLGRVPDTSPAEVLARGPETANSFVRLLCEGGPLALAEMARKEHGFVLPEQVSQDCELCFITRSYLRTFHPEVFGPSEVYDGMANG